MKPMRIMLSAGAVLVVLAALVAFSVLRIGSALAVAPNTKTWHQVPSPNETPAEASSLHNVAALSSSDIWSVGQYYIVINNQSVSQTLTEHWNGTRWSIVPSPDATTTGDWLYGVAAVASNDVWTVGYYWDSSFAPHTLTEHWNGTQWSIVPSPNPDPCCNSLYGVAVVAANDVWAVGDRNTETLIEHWNGSAWSVIPSANPTDGFDAYLQGITAFASNDIWAVGSYLRRSGNQSQIVTLTEQWNGSAWSIVSSPNGGVAGSANTFFSVSGVSSSDLWAVGFNQSSSPQHKYIDQTLTEHWNGTQWSVVPSPNPNSLNSTLSSVTATASNNVWAVGSYKDQATKIVQELILHWNGTRWLKVASPTVETGVTSSNAYALTLVPHTTQLWSVGAATQNNNGVTFITTND